MENKECRTTDKAFEKAFGELLSDVVAEMNDPAFGDQYASHWEEFANFLFQEEAPQVQVAPSVSQNEEVMYHQQYQVNSGSANYVVAKKHSQFNGISLYISFKNNESYYLYNFL